MVVSHTEVMSHSGLVSACLLQRRHTPPPQTHTHSSVWLNQLVQSVYTHAAAADSQIRLTATLGLTRSQSETSTPGLVLTCFSCSVIRTWNLCSVLTALYLRLLAQDELLLLKDLPKKTGKYEFLYLTIFTSLVISSVLLPTPDECCGFNIVFLCHL